METHPARRSPSSVSYRRSLTFPKAKPAVSTTTSVRAYDPENVFIDVAGIAPGVDFRKAIDDNVAACGVLLARHRSALVRHYLHLRSAPPRQPQRLRPPRNLLCSLPRHPRRSHPRPRRAHALRRPAPPGPRRPRLPQRHRALSSSSAGTPTPTFSSRPSSLTSTRPHSPPPFWPHPSRP